MPAAATEQQAYEAGSDARLRGPNTTNCHFRYFARPELTAAWEQGKAGAVFSGKKP